MMAAVPRSELLALARRIYDASECLSLGPAVAVGVDRIGQLFRRSPDPTGDELLEVLSSFWSRGEEAGNDDEPLMPDAISALHDEAAVMLLRAGYDMEWEDALYSVCAFAARTLGSWQRADEVCPGCLPEGWDLEVDGYWIPQFERMARG